VKASTDLHFSTTCADFADIKLVQILTNQSNTLSMRPSDDMLEWFTVLARSECRKDFAKVENFVKPGGPCDIIFERMKKNSGCCGIFLRLGSTVNDMDVFAWLDRAVVYNGNVQWHCQKFLPQWRAWLSDFSCKSKRSTAMIRF
jgi:hypothetical protein